MRRILACAVAVLATPALSSAALIFEDDFDSYADTAALGGVWTLTANQTLDTANGNPGQSLAHNGTLSVSTRSFAPVYPEAGETLVFEADIYDNGAGNKKLTAGIRQAAGSQIIEMGVYNDPAATGYAIRTVLFGAGSNALWLAFDNMVNDLGAPISNAPVVGWHRLRAEITDSNATFTIDLNSDGNINGTRVVPLFQNAARTFDIIRLGNPAAAGPGGSFDNIRLTLVPEPTTALLAAFGLAAAGFRRR